MIKKKVRFEIDNDESSNIELICNGSLSKDTEAQHQREPI